MKEAASLMSSRALSVLSGRIQRDATLVHAPYEVRVLHGPLHDQVHPAPEQALQLLPEAEVPVEETSRGARRKGDNEVQIAPFCIESFAHRRAEKVEPAHAVALADPLQFFPLVIQDQAVHVSNYTRLRPWQKTDVLCQVGARDSNAADGWMGQGAFSRALTATRPATAPRPARDSLL